MLEIELKDLVKDELEEKDEKEGESPSRPYKNRDSSQEVRKISNGKITDFAGGGIIREELIRKGPKPITELDLILNFVSRLSWNECRTRAYGRCETLFSFFNWTDEQFRDCVTVGYIRCGEPSRVEVDPERFLENFLNFRKNIAAL